MTSKVHEKTCSLRRNHRAVPTYTLSSNGTNIHCIVMGLCWSLAVTSPSIFYFKMYTGVGFVSLFHCGLILSCTRCTQSNVCRVVLSRRIPDTLRAMSRLLKPTPVPPGVPLCKARAATLCPTYRRCSLFDTLMFIS